MARRIGVPQVLTALVVFATAGIPASNGAERADAPVRVTVNVSGVGVVQSVPPDAIDCGTGSTRCVSDLEPGSTLILRGTPGVDSYFAGWDGACVGAATECEIAVKDETIVGASFPPGRPPFATPFPLDVTRSVGGAVSSVPEGVIACGSECATGFPGGGSLTLRAAPEQGFDFAGWFGDCSGTGECRVTLTEGRAVTAAFRPRLIATGSSLLHIENRNPPPPGFSSSSAGTIRITTPAGSAECREAVCEQVVPHGQDVIVAVEEGSLRGWEGVCFGSADPCRFTVTGPTNLVVSFRPSGAVVVSYAVNVTRFGSGTVTSVPDGLGCGPTSGCAAAFRFGIRVRLTAASARGWRFSGWQGDCSGTGACSVTTDATRSVYARFEPARHALRVRTRGLGRGRVVSEPAGIDCPPTCATEFEEGESVGLRVLPATDSLFGGWSNTCTGGVCLLSVTAPASVDARFDRCAAKVPVGFAAETRRTPRRVVVTVRLADRASVRVRVLRKAKRLALKSSGLAAGQHRLVVGVPAGKAGPARVELRVIDLCGSSRTLTRSVRLPGVRR
jgi:hypothetical protein